MILLVRVVVLGAAELEEEVRVVFKSGVDWVASDVRDDDGLVVEEEAAEDRLLRLLEKASSRDLYVLETASLRKDDRVISPSARSHLVRPMLWDFWNVAVAFLIGQIEPRLSTADRPSVRTYAVHSSTHR